MTTLKKSIIQLQDSAGNEHILTKSMIQLQGKDDSRNSPICGFADSWITKASDTPTCEQMRQKKKVG